MDYFDELELGCALISETWLKESPSYQKMILDLSEGEGIGIVAKHRNQKRHGKIKTGGGVAILYRKNKIPLKEYQPVSYTHLTLPTICSV